MRIMVLGAALALAACGGTSEEEQAALVENAVENAQAIAENVAIVGEARDEAAAAPSRDEWVGKWIGVEGMVLTIEKNAARPSHYRLTNQWGTDRDASGVFEGYATKRGIAFIRPDGAKELTPGDGDATGLKWLAGKGDCLIVAPGEGYCRD